MSSAACQPRDQGPFRVDIPRVFCKNAVVCRQSIPANQFYYDHSYPREGVCLNCAMSGHRDLDIIECADECPACYRPMNFGVRGRSCAHRTCPWCAHCALFGFPRPTYETFATDHNPYDPCRYGDDRGQVYIHDDGRVNYEFRSGFFVRGPEDDAPVKQPDPDEDEGEASDGDSDLGAEPRMCPICAREQSARPCDLD